MNPFRWMRAVLREIRACRALLVAIHALLAHEARDGEYAERNAHYLNDDIAEIPR